MISRKNIKTKININIRCNINNTNSDQYPKLKELIDQIAINTGNNIVSYPGRMDLSITVHDKKQVEDLEYTYFDYLEKSFDHMDNSYSLCYRLYFCFYQNINSLIIDDEGNIHKCLTAIGNKKTIYANVLDYNSSIKKINEYLDDCLKTVWPDDDKECMECKLLPYCHGGCPLKRQEEKKNVMN